MNSPFDYTPSKEMLQEQQRLVEKILYICSEDSAFAEEISRGKMFGILIYTSPLWEGLGEARALHAYSGQICGRFDYKGFVPAIFDYLAPDGYFKQEEERIVEVSKEIEMLKQSAEYKVAKEYLATVKHDADTDITSFREYIKSEKGKSRDIHTSQYLNAELHRKKLYWRNLMAEKQAIVDDFEGKIREFKLQRQHRSDQLQQWLFDNYKIKNYKGEACTLDYSMPAGTGDCCEPKLLHYAYTHNLQPIEIGMFWWGESPKGEIRHHLQFYPACHGKCGLILPWMMGSLSPRSSLLASLEGQKSPSPLNEGGEYILPPVIYVDDDIIVIDKPSGMLSVPGKSDEPSVLSLLQKEYPGVLSVHRLDMDTSGLLVYARNKEAHKHLQRQFAEHTIQKTYLAELERPISGEGEISLPLRPDLDDRPRQMVDFEYGKPAITHYKSLGVNRVELTPLTGRTHQLRMHCAHKDGLDNPIKGDRLYGTRKLNRLMLHAYHLEFTHPCTGERLTFESASSLHTKKS